MLPPRIEDGTGHPRVALSVSDRWARESASRAVRRSGGTPILLSSLADIPGVCDVCVGTVCDLSPWNESAADQFRDIRRQRPLSLFVLYVPEEHKSFAMPLDEGDPSVRCCIQDPSPEALEGLNTNLNWLIACGATSEVISRMLEGRVPANALSMAFLQWAVRAVARGQRRPVAAAAQALIVAPRTLARQLKQCLLPPPVEFYGWVKLAIVAWTAEREQVTLGRAAKRYHLNSTSLFALKSRLLPKSLIATLRTTKYPFQLVVQAFRDRCDGRLYGPGGPDLIH